MGRGGWAGSGCGAWDLRAYPRLAIPILSRSSSARMPAKADGKLSFPAIRKGDAQSRKKRKVAQDGKDLTVAATKGFDAKLDQKSQEVLIEFDLNMKFGPTLGIS